MSTSLSMSSRGDDVPTFRIGFSEIRLDGRKTLSFAVSPRRRDDIELLKWLQDVAPHDRPTSTAIKHVLHMCRRCLEEARMCEERTHVECKSLEERLRDYETKITELKTRLEYCELVRKQLQDEVERCRLEAVQYLREVGNLREKIAKLEVEAENLKQRVELLERTTIEYRFYEWGTFEKRIIIRGSRIVVEVVKTVLDAVSPRSSMFYHILDKLQEKGYIEYRIVS